MLVKEYIVLLILFALHRFGRGQSLDRPPLIACTEYEILMVDETTWEMHSLYKPIPKEHTVTRFSSVDFHHEKQMLFFGQFPWPSGRRGEIASAKLVNGTLTEIKTISSTGNSPLVAVDWIEDKIYWKCTRGVCGNGGAIYMANLDGSDKRLVKSNIFSIDDSNFQLDPINRWIYLRSKTATGWNGPSFDVLKRINMDDNNNYQILDTCDNYHCFYRFAIDNTNNGNVYWMNFMSSTVKSIDVDNSTLTSYDFGAYEFEKILYVLRKIIKTIDVSFTIAYKGSLYGLPEYRLYDLKGAIARLDTRNSTITYLPPLATSVKLETYRVFHQTAQPKPRATRQLLERPPILAMTESEIYKVDEITWEKHLLYKRKNYNIEFVSFDFHYERKILFIGLEEWELGKGFRGKIMSARLQNNGLTDIKMFLIKCIKPELAVDWIKDKIYCKCMKGSTGSEGVIYSSNLDGSDKTLLRNVSQTEYNSNLQLDPINRRVYILTKTKSGGDVFLLMDMDNINKDHAIDICSHEKSIGSLYCNIKFAIDNADNGRMYWMDDFHTTVYSTFPGEDSVETYDFSKYKLTVELPHGINITTIEVPFSVGFLGSLYGIPWFREYDKRGVIGRLNIEKRNVDYLPSLGINLRHFRIFHPNAQPNL